MIKQLNFWAPIANFQAWEKMSNFTQETIDQNYAFCCFFTYDTYEREKSQMLEKLRYRKLEIGDSRMALFKMV